MEIKYFQLLSGSVVVPDENGNFLVTNHNIITGGTGRFARATGSFTQMVLQAFTFLQEALTFDGTISY